MKKELKNFTLDELREELYKRVNKKDLIKVIRKEISNKENVAEKEIKKDPEFKRLKKECDILSEGEEIIVNIPVECRIYWDLEYEGLPNFIVPDIDVEEEILDCDLYDEMETKIKLLTKKIDKYAAKKEKQLNHYCRDLVWDLLCGYET